MRQSGNILLGTHCAAVLTLSNRLPCAPFVPVMVGRDRGSEKHLGINDMYYITVIPTVLSYSGELWERW